MQKVWGVLGVVFMVLLPAGWSYVMVTTYKTQWDFGPRYGMPVALVATDGKHYADGEPLYPLEALAKSGVQEEIWLAFLGFMGVSLTFLFHMQRDINRMRKRLEERERRSNLNSRRV